MNEQEERNWAVIAHLSALAGLLVPFGGNVLGPLVVWLIQREQSALVDRHGKEALNFQITMLIAMVAAGVLVLLVIGVLLLPLIALFDLIMIIIAAVKVSQGEDFRYPFTLRLIE